MIQIDRLKIVPLAWQGATATASHQASDPNHLLSHDREEVFYSASRDANGEVPELTINISWPEPIPLDLLNIDRHNLSGTATVQHQLFESGQQVYDSGVSVAGIPIPAGEWMPGIHSIGETYGDKLPNHSSAHYLIEPVYTDRWQITINDPYNPDGQIAINRLPVGLALQLQNNFSWGGQLTVVDSTEHLPTSGGGVDIQRGDKFRRLSETLDWADEQDRAQLLTELADSKSRLLYIAAYPTAPESGLPDGGIDELAWQFLGVRENDLSIRRTSALFGSAALNFREV